jgi:ATPase family AAA domain-containing protein 3A/B
MSNKNEGASKESRGMYGFDPSGLERAATAAKYLDSSPNAKNAFELATKEEELKITKEKRLIK